LIRLTGWISDGTAMALLILIAHNEEHDLPGTLAALQGLADRPVHV
jgi:hypothetical protein